MKIKNIWKPSKQFMIAPLATIILAAIQSLQADGFRSKYAPKFDADIEKCGSPYLMVNSDSPELDKIPLKHTEATVNVSGVIANVKVQQVYVNNGESPIEAIYVFPASTNAAVHGMTMQIGERRIKAVINETAKARAAYEQAKSQGKTASLLEQERPNVFQMNVSNIMPGDTLKVELLYTELLVPTDGVYSFVYPTVVGPRYHGDPGMAMASANENWVSNPYQSEGEDPHYSFKISGTINAGMPIKKASCNTHNLDIKFNGPTKASFSSGLKELAGGNKDVIIDYQLRGSKVESGVLLFEGENENFFVAMLEPPKKVLLEDIPPREYVFIVDVSGSMHGFPLDVSKTLMKELLSDLRPIDRFNVLLFASGNAVLSERSLPATEQNIAKAMLLISKQNGGGGTQLLPALKEALKMPHEIGVSRTMVIATDGYVSVDKEAIDLIRNNLGEANFFTFGIGSSVNRFLIEGLAHAGKGEPFVLTNDRDAKKGAAKFKTYIQSPVLTNIDIDFAGLEVYDVEPMSVPDVFADRPVVVFGKYKGSAYGKLKITGSNGAGPYKKEIEITPALASADNEALKYLWARKRIQILDDYADLGRSASAAEEVKQLGLQYNLLTQYTSFVAIDSEIRNKNGTSTTVVQPLPLPEGVSDMAVSGSSSYGAAKSKFSNMEYSRVSAESASLSMADERMAKHEVASEELEIAEVEEDFDFIYESPEKLPEFVGGQKALEAYIIKQLALSTIEAEKWKTEKVVIRFVINVDGSLEGIKVLRTKDKELKARILKLVKEMPRWNPGEVGGQKVKSQVTLPIKIG